MNMFKEVADIKTSDELNLPTPKITYDIVSVKPTATQEELVQELSDRATKIHSGSVDPSTDNMLKITGDGRKLGLDQRAINPNLPDEPQTKVNACINNIFKIWEENKEDKLTQLVFCDISTPKANKKAKEPEEIKENVAKSTDNPDLELEDEEEIDFESLTHQEREELFDENPFSVYEDIREKLIEKGVPPEEIKFIHEAKTEAQKKDLFAKIRSGDVRVMIGSTAKCGAGMNVQDKLIALHDLDAPWRPGDLRQRSGRIERQGNQNKEAFVFRYVTESTFDAYLWQTLENKQKFISQIMTSKSPVRSCDDLDEVELAFAEIKAICAGDPQIKEKMDLEVEVGKLKLLKSSHMNNQHKLEDRLLQFYPQQIAENKDYIERFKQDIVTLAENTLEIPQEQEEEAIFQPMTIKGDVLTDKDNASASLQGIISDMKPKEPVEIGSYRGFTMHLSYSEFSKEHTLSLRGAMSHTVTLGSVPKNNLKRIDNALEEIPKRLKGVEVQLENLQNQQEQAKIEVLKPFPHTEELNEKSQRLAVLDKKLALAGSRGEKPIPEEGEKIAKARPSIMQALKEAKGKGDITGKTPEKKSEKTER